MKTIGMAAVMVAGLLAGSAAQACSDAQAQMDRFRASAMARIQADNRASLDQGLTTLQTALRDQVRRSYLASQPASNSGAQTSKAAP